MQALGKHFGIQYICIPNVLMTGEYKKDILPEIENLNPWERPSRMYEADIVYITKSDYLVEVEIKVSLYDFEQEFKSKQKKHDAYLNELVNPGKKLPDPVYKLMPNRMFYAVESHLVKEVFNIVNGTPYGVMEITRDFDNPVKVIRPAGKLHHGFPTRLWDRTVQRCSSELTSMYFGQLKF